MGASRRGRHVSVLDMIGRQIVTGALAAGEPLDLDRLARQAGASRTALREVFRVLGAKGMVRAWPKRGTFIMPRGQWNWLDPLILRWYNDTHEDFGFLDAAAELREIVEPAAARLAAARRTDDEVLQLEAALQQMAVANTDANAFMRADVEFHRVVLESTHNELITQFTALVEAALRAHDQLVQARHWVDSLAVHRDVLDAVARSAGDDAEGAMLAILLQARKDMAEAQQRP